MKKLIYIFVLFSTVCAAQVGIGTVTPLEELHVAGATSTFRIESLNSVNNSTYNDGVNLAPLYVDGKGDITLGNGTGASGTPSLNFLIDVTNFIPDSPYGFIGTGTVVNNNAIGETSVEGQITSVNIDVPQDAIVEVKYGVTLFISGTDLSTGFFSYIAFEEAVAVQTYFVVDINADGLSPTELSKKYGIKGQSYETNNGGSVGYPYMNGQGYMTLPAGNHDIYFYGVVKDSATSFTCVGFGGTRDYLKIRVYN